MKKILLVLVWLSYLAAGVVWAQDPNGPDTVYLESQKYKITPGGGDLEVQIWLKTDNALDKDKVIGFQMPLVWSSTNSQAQARFDPTRLENQASASGLFRNSAIESWGIFILLEDSINHKVELAAVCTTSSGLLSGSHLLATLTFTLLDTTTICLDTTQNMGRSLLFVTSQGFGYVPGFYSGCFSAEFGALNTPPYFVAVPDTVRMLPCGYYQLKVEALDDDSDPLSYQFEITPAPASPPTFVDSGNGAAVMSWAPALDDTGTFTITWTVTDWSESVDALTTVIVKDLPSVDLLPADINCDGKVTLGDIITIANHLFKGMSLPDCVRGQ